jgi:hypothetical protein
MQVSNECYTRINELADEFGKAAKMTTEMKELLIEMIADEPVGDSVVMPESVAPTVPLV